MFVRDNKLTDFMRDWIYYYHCVGLKIVNAIHWNCEGCVNIVKHGEVRKKSEIENIYVYRERDREG